VLQHKIIIGRGIAPMELVQIQQDDLVPFLFQLVQFKNLAMGIPENLGKTENNGHN
jgi:hypothetical protein